MTSLPTPTNRLIGRDAEVALVRQLLRDNRLVTLTGPPGVGKTRLALEVAAAVAPEFAEGPVFVDLARIRDAALVLPELAHALGIGDAPGALLADRLATALMDREILLVIDNLEHVVDAAEELARVVSACPRLRVLATTRQRLRLNAERECAVSPLPLPHVADRADPQRLSTTASVALLLCPAASRRSVKAFSPRTGCTTGAPLRRRWIRRLTSHSTASCVRLRW